MYQKYIKTLLSALLISVMTIGCAGQLSKLEKGSIKEVKAEIAQMSLKELIKKTEQLIGRLDSEDILVVVKANKISEKFSDEALSIFEKNPMLIKEEVVRILQQELSDVTHYYRKNAEIQLAKQELEEKLTPRLQTILICFQEIFAKRLKKGEIENQTMDEIIEKKKK